MFHVLAIAEMKPRTPTPLKTMELLPEEIVCIVVLGATTLVLKDGFPTIVFGSQLCIGQYLVCFAYVLKHLFCLLFVIGILVRMPVTNG
jgi:hypothetical protein